jgi:hypothetical protein
MWSMTAVNPQTQVIEIGPAGSRCAAGWTSLISGHDVDQRMASAKLYQFALRFFEAQTEHIEVDRSSPAGSAARAARCDSGICHADRADVAPTGLLKIRIAWPVVRPAASTRRSKLRLAE